MWRLVSVVAAIRVPHWFRARVPSRQMLRWAGAPARDPNRVLTPAATYDESCFKRYYFARRICLFRSQPA